jgi:phosphoglycolate phosphatase
MKIHAVMFDLDGTLADTAGEIATALNRTLADLGHAPLAQPEVTSLVGRGVRSLVERALAKAGVASGIDAAVEKFEAHYAQTIATEAALYPGVEAALHRLREAGMPLGVVTNKPRVFTTLLLERFEILDFFEAVVAGDDGIPRKPHGDMLLAACDRMKSVPAATLMLGDSDNDVLAARAAGCPVWCVPYGYNEGGPAEALQCDRLVATVDEAVRLVLA